MHYTYAHKFIVTGFVIDSRSQQNLPYMYRSMQIDWNICYSSTGSWDCRIKCKHVFTYENRVDHGEDLPENSGKHQ